MATMEDSNKILDALRATGRPMDALEIAKAIGFKRKKDVNRVLYKMKDIEISNPGVDPPLWRLVGSSSAAVPTAPSEGATNSLVREPSEAARTPDAAGQLASQLAKTVTLGDDKSATLDNKLIATIEQTVDGGLKISAIPRDQLINRALGASHGPEQLPESHPVQETGTPNHGPENSGKNADSSSNKKVDPINLNSGHEQLLENEKIEDNPSSKEKDLASKALHDNSPGGGAAKSEGASTDKAASTPTAKTKKKLAIAANFSGVPVQETSDSLKEKILDILRENLAKVREEKAKVQEEEAKVQEEKAKVQEEEAKLSAFDIAKCLGHKDRATARQMLEELKKEGKVYDVVRDEISYWGIRNQE